MRVLALEPYYGGSHQAFLDGWIARSAHHFELFTLPDRHWKWRMRHAAISFANEVAQRLDHGDRWDVVFASDMLALAEFRGMVPAVVARLPSICYFHENQWTYPVQTPLERDLHFACTNWTSALAATEVWFNSEFHREVCLQALREFLARMPSAPNIPSPEQIAAKARVAYPGVSVARERLPRSPGPLRILWAARWEHDKCPETFFNALERLDAAGVDFELNVIGQSFERQPPIMARARDRWARSIRRWGFQPDRAAYEAALVDSDVVVSTAAHEFFGISVVEAISAGNYPLLPSRLVYPELLASCSGKSTAEFFYAGSAASLAAALKPLAERVANGDLWEGDQQRARRLVSRFCWSHRVPDLDHSLERVALPFPA